MTIVGWLVLGLIGGFVASNTVNRQGDGFLFDIVRGIVGG